MSLLLPSSSSRFPILTIGRSRGGQSMSKHVKSISHFKWLKTIHSFHISFLVPNHVMPFLEWRNHTLRTLGILISTACPGKGCLGKKSPWLLGWILTNFSTQEKPRGSADGNAGQGQGSRPYYLLCYPLGSLNILEFWADSVENLVKAMASCSRKKCTHKISIQIQKGLEFPWSSW